jgi:hypothetical protein
MNSSVRRVVLPATLVVAVLGVGILLGTNHASKNASASKNTPQLQSMDAYCAAKLEDSNSKLSAEYRKTLTDRAFFSWKLHTCVEVDVTSDSKDPGAMNYVVSDLTYGFVAPPRWHPSESALHISDLANYHHLSAEGYWAPVSPAPDQQSVADSNVVKLECDYTETRQAGDDANTCTETEGYTQFGSIHVDKQTYHIASWSHDEVIATDAERGLSGSTTTTLLIHPVANEIEIVDRTRMDEKQPDFNKGMAGKSFGDHYELHGGMYLLDTAGVFFQCNEDGPVMDMRFDVVEKHHGDVVDVPDAEWNTGAKANHKFTAQECNAAMQKKLEYFN